MLSVYPKHQIEKSIDAISGGFSKSRKRASQSLGRSLHADVQLIKY